uniref:Dystrobrevin n=1 Tax=Panagrellus redivivus TaxID=6233 RepID=A0A7E4W1D4_PANRE
MWTTASNGNLNGGTMMASTGMESDGRQNSATPGLQNGNGNGMNNQPSTAISIVNGGEELQILVDEMRLQDFDSIRFATYRTACKLRFIQTKTNVHLVDIWNMIESFRENGLNAMAMDNHLKISRLELLLTSVFHSLNKRLPTAQHIDTDKSISMLLSFLLGTYDRQGVGRLTVFAVKVAMATMCAGKLVDKLRYIFSQISDSNGIMEYPKFTEYLEYVLALPTAVFEAPTFGFSEVTLQQCFKREEAVTLNHFLDVIMSEACPPCLMWLPLLHRMAAVEHVYHPVVCDSCQVRAFTGFRYKCQRCPNYQLCQSCFWRGQVSKQHKNDHEMKEYSSYKSPTKQLAHSIHKSLRCMPLMPQKSHKDYPSKPQRPLDLSNLVPVAPNAMRHNPPEAIPEWTTKLLPGQYGTVGNNDDEHRLIARYCAKLAGRTAYPSTSAAPMPMAEAAAASAAAALQEGMDERVMIAQLEEENNQMLREMALLEEQQGMATSNGQINGIRERRSELEAKMRVMQQTRRELINQLEQLMQHINVNPHTPRALSMSQLPEPLSGIGSMVSTAFREPSMTAPSLPPLAAARAESVPTAQLQADLLHAAGAIANNMDSLVQELSFVFEDSPEPDASRSRPMHQHSVALDDY